MSIDLEFSREIREADYRWDGIDDERVLKLLEAYETAKESPNGGIDAGDKGSTPGGLPSPASSKTNGQPVELPLGLEERVARIEKWIDFWETIETGWSARVPERESSCQKCNEEMLRVKACEHIAEGEKGWERLRNTCPSTMAVADLREQSEKMVKALWEINFIATYETSEEDLDQSNANIQKMGKLARDASPLPRPATTKIEDQTTKESL